MAKSANKNIKEPEIGALGEGLSMEIEVFDDKGVSIKKTFKSARINVGSENKNNKKEKKDD